MGSVGGFDVAREFDEEYFVYSGVYGYSDLRLSHPMRRYDK